MNVYTMFDVDRFVEIWKRDNIKTYGRGGAKTLECIVSARHRHVLMNVAMP